MVRTLTRKRNRNSNAPVQGDEYPQFMNINASMSVANTYAQTTVPLPIVPNVAGGRARVIELLKVFIYTAPDTLAEDAWMGVQLTTKTQGSMCNMGTGIMDFLCFLQYDLQLVTSGAVVLGVPMQYDFTDGQGHGLLIASQNLYVGVNTVGQGGASAVGVKLLYRFKDVPVQEYVGVIQGQS